MVAYRQNEVKEMMYVMSNSDCLYQSVCTENKCGNCIRYMEMSALLESSNIPKISNARVNLLRQSVTMRRSVNLLI